MRASGLCLLSDRFYMTRNAKNLLVGNCISELYRWITLSLKTICYRASHTMAPAISLGTSCEILSPATSLQLSNQVTQRFAALAMGRHWSFMPSPFRQHVVPHQKAHPAPAISSLPAPEIQRNLAAIAFAIYQRTVCLSYGTHLINVVLVDSQTFKLH